MNVSIYATMSANGLISNQRNVPDWLSQEYENGFMEICQKTKAVIMGMKTYNILAPDYLPLKENGTTIVLTSNIETKSANPTVVFTNKNPKDIVSFLEEKGYTEAVIIGGSITFSEFTSSGIVDDIYLVVEPSLFGKGLSLFKDAEFEYKLNLIEITKKNENTIQLHYKIVR